MQSRWSVALACALLACDGPPEAAGPIEPGPPDAAPIAPDAAASDAGPEARSGLVLDDLHIAGFTEDLHPFSALAPVVNPQLETAIQDGQLIFGLELVGMEDSTGQSDDDDLDLLLYNLQDLDGSPEDNFSGDEVFSGGLGGLPFDETRISGGSLEAQSSVDLDLGGIPLPLRRPRIEGTLIASGELGDVSELDDGRLRAAVPAATLALAPNLTGETCPGATMLDVIALGCGFLGVQPDVDLDGDGLEELFDDDGDGSIDRCVEPDGTETIGTDCASGIADGYRIIFVIHGVRALIL